MRKVRHEHQRQRLDFWNPASYSFPIATVIAENMTMVEAKEWRRLDTAELLPDDVTADPPTDPTLQKIIACQDRLSSWMRTEIVDAEAVGSVPEARIDLFLSVGMFLLDIANFSGTKLILDVIQQPSIWAYMPESPELHARFMELMNVFSREDDYRAYRDRVMETRMIDRPCLPCLFIHLRDMRNALSDGDSASVSEHRVFLMSSQWYQFSLKTERKALAFLSDPPRMSNAELEQAATAAAEAAVEASSVGDKKSKRRGILKALRNRRRGKDKDTASPTGSLRGTSLRGSRKAASSHKTRSGSSLTRSGGARLSNGGSFRGRNDGWASDDDVSSSVKPRNDMGSKADRRARPQSELIYADSDEELPRSLATMFNSANHISSAANMKSQSGVEQSTPDTPPSPNTVVRSRSRDRLIPPLRHGANQPQGSTCSKDAGSPVPDTQVSAFPGIRMGSREASAAVSRTGVASPTTATATTATATATTSSSSPGAPAASPSHAAAPSSAASKAAPAFPHPSDPNKLLSEDIVARIRAAAVSGSPAFKEWVGDPTTAQASQLRSGGATGDNVRTFDISFTSRNLALWMSESWSCKVRLGYRLGQRLWDEAWIAPVDPSVTEFEPSDPNERLLFYLMDDVEHEVTIMDDTVRSLLLQPDAYLPMALVGLAQMKGDETLTHALMHFLCRNDVLMIMLRRVIRIHLDSIRSGQQVFRDSDVGNFMVSRACRYHGESYMRNLLEPVLAPMAKMPRAFEVATKKCVDPFFLDAGELNLRKVVTLLLQRFCDTFSSVPQPLIDLCTLIRHLTQDAFPDHVQAAVAGFFFLRFMSAAIACPANYKLCADPTPDQRRAFVLLSKVVTSLANLQPPAASSPLARVSALFEEKFDLVRRALDALSQPLVRRQALAFPEAYWSGDASALAQAEAQEVHAKSVVKQVAQDAASAVAAAAAATSGPVKAEPTTGTEPRGGSPVHPAPSSPASPSTPAKSSGSNAAQPSTASASNGASAAADQGSTAAQGDMFPVLMSKVKEYASDILDGLTTPRIGLDRYLPLDRLDDDRGAPSKQRALTVCKVWIKWTERGHGRFGVSRRRKA